MNSWRCLLPTLRSVRDMGHEFRTRTSSDKYNYCVLIQLIWWGRLHKVLPNYSPKPPYAKDLHKIVLFLTSGSNKKTLKTFKCLRFSETLTQTKLYYFVMYVLQKYFRLNLLKQVLAKTVQKQLWWLSTDHSSESVKVHIGQGLKYNLQYSRNKYHHHFRTRAE